MNSDENLLSLLIPIYNEAEHLAEFLRRIDEMDFGIGKELIFVDDYSTDGSSEILRNHPIRSRHQKIFRPANQGKGAAIHEAIAVCQGNLIVIQDADFEYHPRDLPQLIQSILDDKADIVYGSRFRRGSPQVHRTYHYLGNRFLTALSNLSSGLYLSDMETCYKVFRAEILKNLKLESKRFGFEPEVTAKIARLRARVFEFPVSYEPRNYLEGKKITWRDGVATLWQIVKFNYLQQPDDYILPSMPQKYVRHKSRTKTP